MLCLYIWFALQIITESFPISSSGHVTLWVMIVDMLSKKLPAAWSGYTDFSFLSLVQQSVAQHWAHGPTVVVLILFFASRWTLWISYWRRCYQVVARAMFLLVLANGVTVMWYVVFICVPVRAYIPLWCGFLITALLLAYTRTVHQRTVSSFSYYHALVLGCVQGLALIPGISRFAATLAAGHALGFSARKSCILSLALELPLITGAWVVSGMRVMTDDVLRSILITPALVGVMTVAGILAWFGLRYVYVLVERQRIGVLSYYMVVLSCVAYVVMHFR